MRYISAGESHSKYMNVVIYDVPAGINLSEDVIESELLRRSTGPGRSLRQNSESNKCKITSGVCKRKTTGAAINVVIENNFDEEATQSEQDNYHPRCGHADLPGVIKYNLDDCTNVCERASGRETILRVAAGAVAKELLVALRVEVYSYVKSIGSVFLDDANLFKSNVIPSQADTAISPLLCPDADKTKDMLSQIKRAKKAGDSLGGSFRVLAMGVVPGLGSYVDSAKRLNANIMASVGSIPSVKAVCIGDSDYVSKNVGSATIDQLSDSGDICMRTTNFAGGIEGGMSNGMPIIATGIVKPIPTVKRPINTINLQTMEIESYVSERRTDTCVVPNVAVVAESELAFVIANTYIEKFGRDSLSEIKYALNAYKARIKMFK